MANVFVYFDVAIAAGAPANCPALNLVCKSLRLVVTDKVYMRSTYHVISSLCIAFRPHFQSCNTDINVTKRTLSTSFLHSRRHWKEDSVGGNAGDTTIAEWKHSQRPELCQRSIVKLIHAIVDRQQPLGHLYDVHFIQLLT